MRRTLFALPLLAVVFAGCGDDEPAASNDGPADVTVTAESGLKFAPATLTATAGDITIELVNDDSLAHTLEIEDVDGFKLETSTRGNKDRDSVTLEAGTYIAYCDVPGHREGGMEAELTVE